MSPEEIIKAAEGLGLMIYDTGYGYFKIQCNQSELTKFAEFMYAKGRSDERKRCEEICVKIETEHATAHYHTNDQSEADMANGAAQCYTEIFNSLNLPRDKS